MRNMRKGARVDWKGLEGTVEEVRQRSAMVRLDEPSGEAFEIGFESLTLIPDEPVVAVVVGAGAPPVLQAEEPAAEVIEPEPEPELVVEETAPQVPEAVPAQPISRLPKSLQPGYKPKHRGRPPKPKGEIRPCLNCGEERYLIPSAIRLGRSRYCKKCRGIAIREGRKRQMSRGENVVGTKTVKKKQRGIIGKERHRRTKWYEKHKDEIIETCLEHDSFADAARTLTVPWGSGQLTGDVLRMKMLRWDITAEGLRKMRRDRDRSKQPVGPLVIGVELLLRCFEPSHSHALLCPECSANCGRVGINQLVYTFEICSCGHPGHDHLIEQLHHRVCYDEAILARRQDE